MLDALDVFTRFSPPGPSSREAMTGNAVNKAIEASGTSDAEIGKQSMGPTKRTNSSGKPSPSSHKRNLGKTDTTIYTKTGRVEFYNETLILEPGDTLFDNKPLRSARIGRKLK